MDRRNLLRAAGAAVLAPAALAGLTAPALAQMGGDARSMILMAGAFSMRTSQLAAERASNRDLRGFATLEAEEQAAVSAALGATPGSAPLRPDHAQMLAELETMRGARFDRMYHRGQVMGHRELLQLNEQASRAGSDSVSRAVGTVAVPAIKTHLAILNRMMRSAGA